MRPIKPELSHLPEVSGMQSLVVAFATDDGKGFMDRHFGDAKFYELYRIDERSSEYIGRLINTTEEDDEEIHADPKKAGGIVALLRQSHVQVVVSKIFGPNIKRIRKRFVCVLMNDAEISLGIERIQNHYAEILDAWNEGEERTFFNYKVDM